MEVRPPQREARVSRPGVYSGYSERLYEGSLLSSFYVEVRDGTRLALDLFQPRDLQGNVVTTPLPVVWMHTPYNRRHYRGGLTAARYPGAALRLLKYGYVVAVADFRGLFASYGKNIGYNRGEWVDAARWDAYDVTEWLAAQPFCNGRVGMWGCSATGGSQLQAASTAPPHLKAIFPMSCEFDAYPFGAPGGIASPRGLPELRPGGGVVTPAQRDRLAVPVDADRDKQLLAEAVAQHSAGRDDVGYAPFRDSVVPELSEPWWLNSSPHAYIDAINASGVAIYAAANWDEGRTKYGVFFTFNNLKNAKMIVGPGTHCDWQTAREHAGLDIVTEELRFFDYWLKGIDNGVMDEPPVCYYTYGAPAGTEWRTASSWPPPSQQRVRYYLQPQALGKNVPTLKNGRDEAVVEYGVSRENRAHEGLVYLTEPLDADVELTGHPVVDLWVSSTATDGDFVATLEDVAPDGSAVSRHTRGQLRASHREIHDPPYDNLDLPWHRGLERDALPLVPGEPARLVFDLMPLSMVFKAGHRIRLVLTFCAGSATPRLDPPPRVTVHRSRKLASSIALPLIEG